MARVTTPVKGFTGVVAGVSFTDGAGETTDAGALNYFRRHGYGVGSKPAVEPVKGDAQTGAGQGKSEGEASTPAPAKKAAAKRTPAKKAAKKPAKPAK